MSVDYLHFDTYDATTLTSPFNCSFQLANPLKKVNKIYLKSAEIPVGWFNIRTEQTFQLLLCNNATTVDTLLNNKNNALIPLFDANVDYGKINTIRNQFGSQIHENSGAVVDPTFEPPTILSITNIGAITNNIVYIAFTIPANMYSITTLLNTINQGIQNFHLANTFLPLGNKVPYLSVPSTTDFNYNVSVNFDPSYNVITGTSELMTSILGFSSMQTTSNLITLSFSPLQTNFTSPTTNDGYLAATQLYQLYQDTYINIYFTNLPHNNTNFNNKFCSFKVPINSGLQTILYSGDNAGFTQYITISDPNYIFSYL